VIKVARSHQQELSDAHNPIQEKEERTSPKRGKILGKPGGKEKIFTKIRRGSASLICSPNKERTIFTPIDPGAKKAREEEKATKEVWGGTKKIQGALRKSPEITKNKDQKCAQREGRRKLKGVMEGVKETGIWERFSTKTRALHKDQQLRKLGEKKPPGNRGETIKKRTKLLRMRGRLRRKSLPNLRLWGKIRRNEGGKKRGGGTAPLGE